MKNFYTYLIVALTGGAGYCLIEILYRGRTHYSMFFAGAIVLSSFYYINQKYEMSFGLKCLVGMLIITGVELLFGLIFNIILKEHVWDYSGVPLNFLGTVFTFMVCTVRRGIQGDRYGARKYWGIKN